MKVEAYHVIMIGVALAGLYYSKLQAEKKIEVIITPEVFKQAKVGETA